MVVDEVLATGAGDAEVLGGSFTGSGWQVVDSGSRLHWDLGQALGSGLVRVTIDGITLDNLLHDNNHLIELFDEGGHFDAPRAINFRVYGADAGVDHGDTKLKLWTPLGAAEARGGVVDWDGGPHVFTVAWDGSEASLDRDGVRLVTLDTSGLDLHVRHLWLPLNDWLPGLYDAPIGSLYSDLHVEAWAVDDETTSPPIEDGDPDTVGVLMDAGVALSGPVDVADLPVQAEDLVPTEVSYLLFDLRAVCAPVTGAVLRLRARADGSAGGDAVGVFAVADTTWDEATVTWASRPAVGALLGSTPAVEVDGSYEVDVVQGVAGLDRVAFALSGSGADGAHFSSKEEDPGRAAELAMTCGGTTSPTSPPSPPTDPPTLPTQPGGDDATGASENGATSSGCRCVATGSAHPFAAWLLATVLPVLRRGPPSRPVGPTARRARR